jgi:hypothetical protein
MCGGELRGPMGGPVKDADIVWFHIKFQNTILTRHGAAFQDFFSDLMEAAYPNDFRRVRPYGNEGDLKCDGFVPSSGTVFQVYSPRSTQESVLIKKVGDDLDGARNQWKGLMRRWVFVHNDPDGLPPRLVQELELQRKRPENQETAIDAWSVTSLWSEAQRIPRESLVALLGPPPQHSDFETLSFEAIGKLLRTIRAEVDEKLEPIAPVSPEKAAANRLGAAAVDYLELGRSRAVIVERYLNREPDPTLGEQVAARFHEEYVRLRNHGYGPDEIFVRLQDLAGGAKRQDPQGEAAIWVVMAYLFDHCDIFENASEATT